MPEAPAAPAPEVKAPATAAPAAAAPAAPAPGAPWMEVGKTAPEAPKPDAAKGEQKAPEPPAKAPEKFALKVPDGAEVNPASLEKLVSFAKENGLTEAQAQAILNRNVADAQAEQAALVNSIKAQNQAWLEEARKAPDFKDRAEAAKRALDFADPDGSFRKKLDAAGMSNNPDLVDIFAKFGKGMKEDSLHAPSGGVPKTEKPVEERMKERYAGQSK